MKTIVSVGAHLEMTEACCAGGVFDGGEDQRAETLAGEVGIYKDGADLGSVGYWVEQFGFTVGGHGLRRRGFCVWTIRRSLPGASCRGIRRQNEYDLR